MRLRLPITAFLAGSILLLGSVHFIRAAARTAAPANDEGVRTPVLIELFTSEGCSSCPPADALLQRLDQSQPITGAELIVLSEHVDYWDDIGWRDPYSSREYTERQSAYAAQFGHGSVYTPQMVVDGHFEFVGSDERRATQAIRDATKVKKAPACISVTSTDDHAATVHVEAGPLPSPIATQSADVFLAIADNSDESQVSRGENAGRTLQHVAVLRNLIRIGAVDNAAGFAQDMKIDLNGRNPRSLRIAVIVQEAAAGRVWAVGLARFTN
jgi:hypothetical protein